MWSGKALWIPAAFLLLAIGHCGAALFLPVADCDETFNFLEPIHFLLYGSGLQTWENCPLYALRSWLFTWIYTTPAFLLSCVKSLRSVDLYFFNRVVHGLVACFSELFLVCSVWRAVSGRIAAVTLALLVFNYPIPHAAVSALPTSFVMINYFMALGCWLCTGDTNAGRTKKNVIRNDDGGAHHTNLLNQRQGGTKNIFVFGTVFFVVFASTVVWPFAGFAALPIACDLLVRFPKASVVSLLLSFALILPLALAFDTWHYCRLTWSSWNLVRYNLRGGAELYGVEPWYYFIKNLLLNAHMMFVAGLFAPCVVLLKPALGSGGRKTGDGRDKTREGDAVAELRKKSSRKASPPTGPKTRALDFFEPLSTLSRGRMLLHISPFFLWFFFWLTVPHKEERFMAPVYPFLVLAAAESLTCLFFSSTPAASSFSETATENRDGKKGQLHCPRSSLTSSRVSWRVPGAGCALLLLFAVLSLSRGVAVYHFYAGPQRLLYDNYYAMQKAAVQKVETRDASNNNNNNNRTSESGLYTLCVGREWYRFPSSFFLDTQRARVAFLKTSHFSGALPLPFARHDAHATCRCGGPGVNDLNQEILAQYVSNVTVDCDVIFDSHSAHEPRALRDYPQDVFTHSLARTERRLLDVDRTPLWCRVLYYPFGISERCAVWRRLELLTKKQHVSVA